MSEVYLISGGSGSDMEMLTRDFRTALSSYGEFHPRVACIGAANGDSDSVFGYFQRPVRSARAMLSLVPTSAPDADAAFARQMLEEADAVFLTGGDVEAGMEALRRMDLVEHLRGLHRAGKPFLGIEEGAVMLGRHWARWDRAEDDATASLVDCLGLVPMTFAVHGEERDWRDLKCVLRLLGPGAEGFGLAAGGAYRARDTGTLRGLRVPPVCFYNEGGAVKMRE